MSLCNHCSHTRCHKSELCCVKEAAVVINSCLALAPVQAQPASKFCESMMRGVRSMAMEMCVNFGAGKKALRLRGSLSGSLSAIHQANHVDMKTQFESSHLF